MSNPLHELAQIIFKLENSDKISDGLEYLYMLNILEAKCKFQIYHMYLILEKIEEDMKETHYKNILIFEKFQHNLIKLKEYYETKFKNKDESFENYSIEPSKFNFRLEAISNESLETLESKIVELGLFSLKTGGSAVTQKKKKIKKIEFFYADWCGYCTEFKPIWEKITKKIKDKIKTKNYNADDSKNKKILNERGVRGYPTIIIVYQDNSFVHYEEERTLKGFMKFISN